MKRANRANNERGAPSLIAYLQSLGLKENERVFASMFVGCAATEDGLPEMDGGIFSYKVKTTKPEHGIYRLLCERYGLEPRE